MAEIRFNEVFETLLDTDVNSKEWDVLTREYILLSLKISVGENRKKFM